ncbi:MAG: SH3 domain-containing protein [Hyphomicrobiaceae bacterium]|nr:SH3 domain-containing protein [Hyphomicrobiaceae bacterium]
MRTHRFSLAALAATTILIAGALLALPASAQQQGPPLQQGQQLPPPKPYKPIAIKLPQPVADQSFVAFRKQMGDLAQKMDRAGLAKLVAPNFFLIVGDKDAADRKKPGIDNLAKALNLDGKDTQGWEVLAEYAQEPTAEPDPDHKGVVCAPADPTFDENAAEQLAKDTETDPGDWGYPVKDGVEVRSGAKPNSPVIDKLGLYLVRVYPDDSPAGAVEGPDFVRIVLPSGKLGYVASDQLLPLGNEQLCYVKEGNAWKIAGFVSTQ